MGSKPVTNRGVESQVLEDNVQYVAPVIRPESEFFWRSGADGILRFLCCGACSYYIHPPAPFCPRCGGRDAKPAAVKGTASIYSYTINHHPWSPNGTPYVLAVVAIDEQEDVRLTTRIICSDVNDVEIGMKVVVTFKQVDDVWLPLFRPAGAVV